MILGPIVIRLVYELLMNHGTIIEQGTHQQLLDKKGFYYDLYNSQFIGATVEDEPAQQQDSGFSGGFPGGFSGGGFPGGGFPGKKGKKGKHKGKFPEGEFPEGESPEGFPAPGEFPEGFPVPEGMQEEPEV